MLPLLLCVIATMPVATAALDACKTLSNRRTSLFYFLNFHPCGHHSMEGSMDWIRSFIKNGLNEG